MPVSVPYTRLHVLRQVFDHLGTYIAPTIAKPHPERGRRWGRWWGGRWWERWERWLNRKFWDLRFEYLRFPGLPCAVSIQVKAAKGWHRQPPHRHDSATL